jgi:hypothetical protein
LDEKALAACMAYVYLNPVRAGMAKTPEQSEHTTITERTNKLKQSRNQASKAITPVGLLPFAGNLRKNMPKGLPFRLKDYLELVDWTGRAILELKWVSCLLVFLSIYCIHCSILNALLLLLMGQKMQASVHYL